MQIRGLYGEIQNLPGFCLHEWRNTDRQMLELRDEVISLERYSHDESSAVGITEIGSVEVEKGSNYAGNG